VRPGTAEDPSAARTLVEMTSQPLAAPTDGAASALPRLLVGYRALGRVVVWTAPPIPGFFATTRPVAHLHPSA